MTTTETPLVFRIDEKLLQRRPPRLTLAATLNALCKQVQSKILDPNFVVEILNENQLLPYMINQHDSKNLFDASLGRNTNASKIGDLIVSEECIRGTYELCISFLEFVLAIVRNTHYRDVTKTMLASVTYVANEIYTCQHIWTYKNIKDMNKILILCTEIFHQVLADVKEPINGNKYSELEVVCLISLSQNQAHKQLLDVIVEGKNSIKKHIDEHNVTDEKKIADIPIVKSVRQSLLIFNKLLSHSKYLKAYCDIETLSPSNLTPSAYQHGASSSNAPMTNIERAIFDTSIRPGLLQHLFSYIYQKSDSLTACLATDLIKNIAKKFSMSLMACLGSEADKVCDFFVECLSSKEINVDLEVAILDLLSTCVKHQPGLIELFLNFKHKATSDDGSKEVGSLEVVMGLLKECTTRKEASYKLIHTYVMKFILTFWQKQHSAIEQFDKADKFWSLIMQPLVNFLESPQNNNSETDPEAPSSNETVSSAQELTNKLNSYSLMILAREIFSLNAGMCERKINPNLSSILSDLSNKNLVGKYSLFIKKKYTNIPSKTNNSEDYNRALMAWRDFLTSYSKYRPFDISTAVENQIIRDLLACMTAELRVGEELNKDRITAASETLLLIWTKWMPKNATSDDMFQSVHDLLYLADAIKDYLPFSFLLTFQSTLNMYLVRNRDYLVRSKRSFDLLEPSLQLMQFGLKIMERYLHQQAKSIEFNNKPGVESRLCLAGIMTLRFIIDVSREDVKLWISYLQMNLKTDSLIEFFILLINKRAGPEICLSIVELLLCLSSINETADYLSKAALIGQVNMIVVSTYERPYTHLSQLASLNKPTSKDQAAQSNQQTTPMETVINNSISDTAKIYLDNMNSDHNWLPIYWHVIRLNISMMLTLNNHYMSAAVEFLSIHCIRVCEQLELLRTKPRSVNMEEALQTIYLISLILKHGCMWIKKNRQSYDAISEEIGKTAYTLATSALPPPTTTEQTSGQQQHTSIKPRDCLVYARCCYDFGKYTEAERVLFQTKFGDKNGFIREAAQIYGEELSRCAFHLAALICLKTNRQSDSIDFALQVFSEDSEHLDIVSALSQNRC